MEPAILLGMIGALAYKLVDFVKFLTNRDKNALITQAAAWIIGILVVVMSSLSNIFEGFVLPGMTTAINDLDVFSLVIIGMSLQSVMGITFDFKKAIDGSDSAVVPTIIPGAPSGEVETERDSGQSTYNIVIVIAAILLIVCMVVWLTRR